jgi:predicted RNase H-like HicB family nuclease
MAKSKKIISIKTRFGNFDCLFEKNRPENGYTVTVPKLKGIVTCGENLNEAKKMAKEAIELHCECLLKDNLAEIRILPRYKTSALINA